MKIEVERDQSLFEETKIFALRTGSRSWGQKLVTIYAARAVEIYSSGASFNRRGLNYYKTNKRIKM